MDERDTCAKWRIGDGAGTQRRHHQALAGFPGEDRIGEQAQQGRAWFSRVPREEGQLCVQALPLGLGQKPSLEPGRPRTRRSHNERVARCPLSPEPKARQGERVLCTRRSLCSRAELSRETDPPTVTGPMAYDARRDF